MVIDAKLKFLSKLQSTYRRVLKEHGQEEADARIKHLSGTQQGLIKLTTLRRSLKT